MLDKRKFFIDGAWVAPTTVNDLMVINPATEESCAVISIASTEDVDSAVAAAKKAFTGWANTPKAERIAKLNAIMSEYKRRAADMALAISMEMGAPKLLSENAQVASGIHNMQGVINAASEFEFEHPIMDEIDDEIIIHDPIGVCGLITPWNWPMNQVTHKVIPALAAGCTVVLKPSEIAPLSAIVFAEIVEAAGLPAGVFNMINGDGQCSGSHLSAHPDVDMLSFTGSTRAGVLISQAAAHTVKRVALELGGKGANIIFADADPQAVRRGVLQCFDNSGQSCNAPTRMLVERSIYQQAVECAKETANAVKVGLSNEDQNALGPVVSEQHFEKIQGLIQKGIDEGATLVVGGVGKPVGLDTGFYVQPTVFADVNNQMTIAREEIFGPVLSMIPFDSEEEAVEIANDTPYGLTNYIQTTDNTKAKRVARQMRSGMVRINGSDSATFAPFGGMKQSGNGREGGKWGLEDYLEIKHITDWK